MPTGRRYCFAAILWVALGVAPAYGVLHRLWKDREVHGNLAKKMLASQLQHCDSDQAIYEMEQYGMGSNLHRWSLALCAAMGQHKAVVTAASSDGFDGWLWEDRTFCDTEDLSHPLSCYFEPSCRRNESVSKTWHAPHSSVFPECVHPKAHVNEAGMEILFSRLTRRVLASAENAAEEVFGSEGAPPNLISVHLRWGDKGKEMELLPVSKYVEAVESLVLKHRITNPSVFLTTEDPIALAEFLKAAPKSWKQVLVYKPAVSPDSAMHSQAMDAKANGGATGRHALIALLLALEARYFVLTGASNWSRLINELRKSVLDSDCAMHHQRVRARQLQAIYQGSTEEIDRGEEVPTTVDDVTSTCATDVIDLQPHMKYIKHGFMRPINNTQSADPIKGFLHNAPASPTQNSTTKSAHRSNDVKFSASTYTNTPPVLSAVPNLTPATSAVDAASGHLSTATTHSMSNPHGDWKRVGGTADAVKAPKSHKSGDAHRKYSEKQEFFNNNNSASSNEHSLHGGSCTCTFLKYTPAPIEERWTANIEAWQGNDVDICSKISDEEKAVWINATMALQRDPSINMAVVTTSSEPPMSTWNNALSVHTYRRTRHQQPSPVVDYLHVPIEPTAAMMRDPRKCWSPLKVTYTQSKDYLVPLSLNAAACPAIRDMQHGGSGACTEAGALHRKATRRSQVWLFDAGATLPSVTTNKYDWSGTGFLFQWFEQRGLVFDHVYAWEPKSKATVSFKAVPDALLPSLHFYPDPVNAKDGDVRNPAYLIKTLTRPEDIVILKLDVDSPQTELSIMHQVIEDPELTARVDDFYFEMHCCNEVMRLHGMACSPGTPFPPLKAWYDVAIPAREKGLRMHYWP